MGKPNGFQREKTPHPVGKINPNWYSQLGLILLLGAISLMAAGCDQLPSQVQELLFPSPPTQANGSLPSENVPPPTESTSATVPNNATPSGPQVLTIWVPPQFDPESDTLEGQLLRKRLENFSVEHPGAEVEVRVKAATGTTGLLNSLSVASTVLEPTALPALVALTRSEMEAAALKGLIYPMDSLTSLIDEPDWYNYAKELALIQGSNFGAPFAGDALVLIYRPAKIGALPTSWEDILSRGQPIAFPAADPEGLVTLTLYLSAGGDVVDSQNRPLLEAAPLAEVLKLYAEGARQGAFPSWLSEYQTDSQAWQAYQDEETQWALSWSSRYLRDLPADFLAIPLPPLGEGSTTIADGWMWTLSDPVPERRKLSAELAEYLTAGDFLSAWLPEAGYLPTRPTVLTALENQSLKSLLGETVILATIRPDEDLIEVIGPILREATLDVIERQVNPLDAAQSAVQRVSATQDTP